MRLGIIELSVLALCVDSGGYVDYSRVKTELSGYPRLDVNVLPGDFVGVRSLHVNIPRACRSLAKKRLVDLDCSASGRIQSVRVNVRGLAAELVRRTRVGKRELG